MEKGMPAAGTIYRYIHIIAVQWQSISLSLYPDAKSTPCNNAGISVGV
jgi:hypothetical protein